MSRSLTLAGVAFFTILLVSCGSSRKVVQRPAWIDRPPAYADTIAGVGVASPMANVAVQRERAAHQARLQMARTLRTKVIGLIRDWINENKDYFTDAGESLSYFESASEEITDATLVGSAVKEYYKDSDGTLYALVTISKTQAIENMLDKMKQLSSDQSRIIQQRAGEAFRRLEERARQTRW